MSKKKQKNTKVSNEEEIDFFVYFSHFKRKFYFDHISKKISYTKKITNFLDNFYECHPKFSFFVVKIQSVSPIQINEARWIFSSRFWPLLNQEPFFEAAGAVAKIYMRLKPNHHNQAKVVHVPDTLCILYSKSNFLWLCWQKCGTICLHKSCMLNPRKLAHTMLVKSNL